MGAQKHIAEGTEIWCLQDGGVTFGEEVFPDVTDPERGERLRAAGLTGADTAFNAYLLKHPDGALDLVDCGCGAAFGPAGGLLPSRLKALGVTPGKIRNLILTHLHGDHCGGAVLDGVAAYPNAQVFLHEAEVPSVTEGSPGAAVLAAYEGRITLLTGDEDLPGGLKVWPLYGHTPGHIGLKLGDSFALAVDILHSFALQLPDPALCPIYDEAPDQARETRRAALDWLAQSGVVWSGSHGIGPRFLRCEKQGAGYRVSPA